MIEKQENKRKAANILDIDTLVPKKHPLRKIDQAVDWNQVYPAAAKTYSPNKGRPGIDPVVLVKIEFLKLYYGYPSLRKTLEEIEVNLAYRWFLGYGFLDKIPHPTTVSRNLKKRFTSEQLDDFFTEVFSSIRPAK